MSIIVAIRTRSEGEWFATDHFANMEIRGGAYLVNNLGHEGQFSA